MIALGDTVPGALATSDCRVSGFYTDFYELAVLAEGGGGPQGLTLTMTGAFDTWLELYRQSGDFLGFDDDIDSTNTNSQLSAIVAPGDYLLAPSSYNPLVVGAYSVSALTRRYRSSMRAPRPWGWPYSSPQLVSVAPVVSTTKV